MREPDGAEHLLLDATLAAIDLVIVTPLYWYSMSWPVKLTGTGSWPGDVLRDAAAVQRAGSFFD